MSRELEIVMLTADDSQTSLRAKEAGVDVFFQKIKDFKEWLVWAKRQRGRNIAMIDDKVTALEKQRDLLKGCGAASVHIFSSPTEALKKIPRLEPPVDAVVTDCNMPGMDGFKLTRELRKIFPRE